MLGARTSCRERGHPARIERQREKFGQGVEQVRIADGTSVLPA
ncbi:MAG: hypothetical protein QOH71_2550 [Blastocatellia bacterium]|jgi:hypothetical protein|nr:hypothetical protein [Blastocatellia bacterium]